MFSTSSFLSMRVRLSFFNEQVQASIGHAKCISQPPKLSLQVPSPSPTSTNQLTPPAPFFPSSTIRLTIHNAVNRTQTNGTHTCPTYNTYNSTTHTCQRISQNVEGDSKGGGAAYFIVILAALVAVLVLAVSLTCLINFCPKARHTFSSPSSSYSRKYKKRARGAIPTLQPASQQNVASGPMSVLGWGDRRSGVSGRTVQEMIATTRSRVENANPDPMVYLNETFSGAPTPTPGMSSFPADPHQSNQD